MAAASALPRRAAFLHHLIAAALSPLRKSTPPRLNIAVALPWRTSVVYRSARAVLTPTPNVGYEWTTIRWPVFAATHGATATVLQGRVSWSMHVSGLPGLQAVLPHRARRLASRPVCSGIRYPLEHQCRHAIGRSVTWSRRENSELVPLS